MRGFTAMYRYGEFKGMRPGREKGARRQALTPKLEIFVKNETPSVTISAEKRSRDIAIFCQNMGIPQNSIQMVWTTRKTKSVTVTDYEEKLI